MRLFKTFLFLLLFNICVNAQQITKVEYFIDTDPGFGSGTSVTITSANNLTKNFTASLTGVAEGIHVLYIRAMDENGHWGIPVSKPFILQNIASNPNITRIEYYFNTDPGYGNGTAVTISSANDATGSFTADISGLAAGSHKLFVRAKDSNNKWSVVIEKSFTKSTVIPTTPSGLVVTDTTGGNVTIKWSKNTNIDFAKYRIYFSTSQDPTTLVDSMLTAGDTSKTFTNIQLQTFYYVRITAVNTANAVSNYSNNLTIRRGSSVPSITSFAPLFGKPGDTITISGTGFSATQASNIVYFGAVKASVASSSLSDIKVTVPFGATFGPITVTVNGLTVASMRTFTPTFLGTQSFNATSFAAGVTVTSGATTGAGFIHNSISADIDGDGNTDVAIVEAASSIFSVFRNKLTGTGTFTTGSLDAKVSFNTGSHPYGIASGDLNGDGKVDIAVVSYNDKTVSAYLNESTLGQVQFSNPLTVSTPINPITVAIGDIDGDGKQDMVVGTLGTLISVYRNTSTSGALSFAPRVDATAGSEVEYGNIALGDVDGDGKIDIVMSSPVANTSGNISIVPNNSTPGAIVLGTKVDFAGPNSNSSKSVVLGDANGDGKLDMFSAGPGGLYIYRNISTTPGTISVSTFQAGVIIGVGTSASLVMSDMDGDAKPDLIIGGVYIMKNKIASSNSSFSTNSFESSPNYTPTITYSISLGDFNNDGRMDIMSATGTANDLQIHRNTLAYVPVPTPISPMNGSNERNPVVFNWSSSTAATSYRIQVGTDSSFVSPTFDTTTALTTVTINNLTANTKYFWRARAINSIGNTNYSAAQGFTPRDIPTITSFTPTSAKPGDVITITGTNFNVVTTNNKVIFGAVSVTPSSGSAATLTVTVPYGATLGAITVTDTATRLTATSKSFFTPTFLGVQSFDANSFAAGVTVTSAATSGGGLLYGSTSADFDGDGKTDIAIGDYNASNFLLYRNNHTGTGAFSVGSFDAKITVNTVSGPYGMASGDLNGDGKIDIAVNNFTDKTVSAYLNESTPGTVQFASPVTMAVSATGSPNSLRIGDIDGDGKNDIVVLSTSAVISVLRNTTAGGTLSFAPKVEATASTSSNSPGNVVLGDIDSDGKLDIIASCPTTNTFGSVSVLLNTSTPGTVSLAAKVEFSSTNSGNSDKVVVGDANGDGKLDIFTVGVSGVNAYRNTTTTPGSLTFQTAVLISSASSVLGINDMDGDGKPDLIVGPVTIFRNKIVSSGSSFSVNSFEASPQYQPTVSYSMSLGDFNNDGRTDILSATGTVNDLMILRNTITLNSPPVIPIFVSALSGDAKVTIKWNKVSDKDILRYRIFADTSAIPLKQIDSTIAGNQNDTSRVISGLINYQKYYFRVAAVDSVGQQGEYSQILSATPTGLFAGEYFVDANTSMILHMNELNGTSVTDSTSLSNNGIATGTTIVTGRFGRARNFNGTSDEITVANSASLNFTSTDPLTIEAWVYRTGNPISGSMHILGKRVGTSDQINYQLVWESGKGYVFNAKKNSILSEVKSDTVFAPMNKWTHVVGSFDGTTLRMYVNGRLLSSAAGNIGDANTADLKIGTSGTMAERWQGLIDEVRISKIARAPQSFNLQAPPVNITATLGNTNISLSWQEGGGQVALTRYKIYRGSDSSNVVLIDSTIQTNFTSVNLESGKRYYYRLSSVDITGFESEKSYAALFITKLYAPALSSQAIQKTRATLIWKSIANAVSYSIYRGADSVTTALIGTVSDTLHIDSTLSPSGKYFYKVGAKTAFNATGDTSFAIKVIAKPETPVSLSASQIKDTRIKIQWSSGGGTPTKYIIYRSLDGSEFSILGTSAQPVFIDSGLTESTNYYYRISALNEINDSSAWSNVLQIKTTRTLPKITALTPIATVPSTKFGTVAIRYTVSLGTADTVSLTGYYSTDSGKTYVKTSNISGKINLIISALQDTVYWNTKIDLPNQELTSVKFYISPTGLGGIGDSVVTPIFSVDNKTPQFAGATVAIGDTNKVTISWGAAADITPPITYRVFIATQNGSFNYSKIDTQLTGTSVTIANLQNFQRYYFVVRSIDAVGNLDTNTTIVTAIPSAKSRIALITLPSVTQRGAIKIPYSVVVATSDTVSLVALHSINGIVYDTVKGIPVSAQKITQSKNDTLTWNTSADISGEVGTVTLKLVPVGRAGDGVSLISSQFAIDNKAPVFGGLVAAIADTSGTGVILQWNRGNDYSLPMKYSLYQSESSTINYTQPIVTDLTDTTIVIKNLTAFKTYYFAVRGSDAVGNSEQNSTILSVVPSRKIKALTVTVSSATYRSSVPISYLLESVNNDTASIAISYSTNNGTEWKTASKITGTQSAITQFGSLLSVQWNPLQEIPNFEGALVKIKIVPNGRGGSGVAGESGLFTVDTKIPEFSGITTVLDNASHELGSLILQWSSAKDTSKPIMYYIYHSQNVFDKNTLPAEYDSLASTSDTIRNLENNKKYYFYVRSRDAMWNIDTNNAVKIYDVPYIADFDGVKGVSTGDLAVFANGWSNNNLSVVDIGPATGTPPNLVIAKDKNRDFEDLMTFSRMWNWWVENPVPNAFFAKRSTEEKQEVALVGQTHLKPNEKKNFTIQLPKIDSARAVAVYIKTTVGSFALDSVQAHSEGNNFSLVNKNGDNGLITFTVASFDSTLEKKNIDRALSLSLYTTKKLTEEPIELSAVYYDYRGAVKYIARGTSSISWRPVVPEVFAISQNYPNPFNPATTIEYQLPKDTRVVLKVYNLLGQEVATLMDGNQKAGYYTARWNAQNFATGVYIYRLYSKDFVQTKKMLLLK